MSPVLRLPIRDTTHVQGTANAETSATTRDDTHLLKVKMSAVAPSSERGFRSYVRV